MQLIDPRRLQRPEFWQAAMLIAPAAVLVLMLVLMGLAGVFGMPLVGEEFNARQAFTLLGAMLFPIGAFIFAKAEYNRARAAASVNWPSAEGEVTKSEIASRSTKQGMLYTLDFACDFAVAGRGYRTEQVQFGNGWVGEQELIEGFAKKYAVGSRHPVYYDPKDPEDAVLERGDQVASDNRGYAWATLVVPVLAGVILLFKTGF